MPAPVFIGGSGHTDLSVWSCMDTFACRISRTNCCHWNAVEFSMNSIWINDEVKWQSVIKLGGNNHFWHYTLGYFCLFCNPTLVYDGNHFQLTDRRSKHSVLFSVVRFIWRFTAVVCQYCTVLLSLFLIAPTRMTSCAFHTKIVDAWKTVSEA